MRRASRLLAAPVLLAAACSLLAGVARAIYPDDHWSYSTRLTESNFADKVQEEIDAGRTLFVRWIASPG